ncbi:MAG: helix-turn-helix domain-containing protein [Clostridia bacterium]|nr:helix-turn-helix domain-containing protein [Clostridia bacterium]
MNKINERVRKIRKQAKYSQAMLGKMLNLKTSTYSQKEREGKLS